MISADLITRKWRRVDIKVSISGEMHVLSWRRRVFSDVVTFDGRQMASASGLIGRDSLFAFILRDDNEIDHRLLLTIDPETSGWDWSGEMRPRGVRLETSDTVLTAFGSLDEGSGDGFAQLFERAIKSIGLA